MPYRLDKTYKYIEKDEQQGFQDASCACTGKKDLTVYSVNMNLVLLFNKPVAARVNDLLVYPRTLVLGLTEEEYELLKSDSRFQIPTSEQKTKMQGRFVRLAPAE